MKTTIEDVARAAGVSITTVSRVINANYPVNVDTKARVEKAVKALSYVPNTLARGLIKKKTFTIGVVVPSMTNLFFPEVVRGIEKTLQPNGYVLFLSETMEDNDKEIRIINMMKERQVDGLIVMGAGHENIENGFFEKVNNEIPFLIINGYNKGVHCNFILTDEEMGAIDGFEYLYELGHRNIAFIRGGSSYSYDLKENAFKAFCEKKNLIRSDDNIIKIKSGNNPDSVEFAMDAAAGRLEMEEPPTAFFCCNDWMAAGAVKGAESLGYNVPGDISVIGFDNIMISRINTPSLTTVDQKMENIGINAAQLLLDIIESKGQEMTLKKIVLETSLIKRDSCGENKTGGEK